MCLYKRHHILAIGIKVDPRLHQILDITIEEARYLLTLCWPFSMLFEQAVQLQRYSAKLGKTCVLSCGQHCLCQWPSIDSCDDCSDYTVIRFPYAYGSDPSGFNFPNTLRFNTMYAIDSSEGLILIKKSHNDLIYNMLQIHMLNDSHIHFKVMYIYQHIRHSQNILAQVTTQNYKKRYGMV